MKCIMCNCDYEKKYSLLQDSTYDNFCKNMGYCSEKCYNNIDFEDKCDTECNYLFKNLYKNIGKNNISILYKRYGKRKRKNDKS